MHFTRSRPTHRSGDEAILPLTNIVFLLLIFFMLAGRLTAPDTFDIKPPQSVSQASAQQSGVDIQISAKGRLAMDGERIALDELSAQVTEILQTRPDTPLRLKADGRGNASRVVAVMHALRDAGAQKLRLITVAAQS